PEDIFTMLQLEKAGDTLFENPLFSAWIKYADDFRLLYKTKLATMSTLMSHYSDEALARMIMAGYEAPSTANIAKRLESELQRDWLLAKQSPNDVFIMLNLKRTRAKMIENPLFRIWYNYGLSFNKINLKTKWDPIVELTQVYGGDKQLASMLVAAMKTPSTEIVATKLQSWQVSLWLTRRMKPAKVHSLLGVEGTMADDVSQFLYKQYVAAYEKYIGPSTG
ncbi:hypothetical protein L917_18886, partial [Phytophthora nicotianae]